MYEMRKRKQIYEDTREMYRTKILVKRFGEIGKATFERS